MKIEEKQFSLELSGISPKDVNTAKIIPNAIVMDILGNKLYKHKIDSTVREILANAKDACFEAKVKTPIEVHIPTMLEPWFSIKDYGIGMTPETIVDVYANYGASTKRGTNDLIGGFGIGAKVASVYSGQFTVTSVKDGYKSIYQFFKNEKGMPSNTCVYYESTKEPNGTEVKISANNASDFSQFEHYLIKYGTWIDYPIVTNKNLKFEKPEAIFTEPKFWITKNNVSPNILVVGGVPYPFEQRNYSSTQISEYRLVYFANIGEVDLIASREELEYTEKTKKYLMSVVDDIKTWYANYKKNKTSFWLHKNKQAWEKEDRNWFNYGFSIMCKTYRKWGTSSHDKIYQKYISVKGLFDKNAAGQDKIKTINWMQACEKIGGDSSTVAFLDESNVPDLIKLGCEKEDIISFESLPKRKIGKRKAYRVLYVKKNGQLGFTTTDTLNKDTFNVSDDDIKGYHRWKYERHNYLIKLIQSGVSITADKTKPSELIDYVKKNVGEHTNVNYCNVILLLEKLGYLKTKTPKTKPKNCDIMEAFGLVTGEHVSLSDKFPLATNYSPWNMPVAKDRTHLEHYLEWVISQDKNALNHKYLIPLK